MRIFRGITRAPLTGRPIETWRLTVRRDLVEALGWEHRDDLDAEIVGGELRVRKLGPRDRSKDRVRGGRIDPFTGEPRALPPSADPPPS